jgi:FMN phosphatase YigB (HAD superfamily)
MAFDECHRIGDERARTALNEDWWQKNKKFWDTTWWILEERCESNLASAYDDLPIELHRLVARLDDAAETFAELAKEGSAEISVVISSNGYPGMQLSGPLLAKIARLGVSVDFDLYCDTECERTHADAD